MGWRDYSIDELIIEIQEANHLLGIKIAELKVSKQAYEKLENEYGVRITYGENRSIIVRGTYGLIEVYANNE